MTTIEFEALLGLHVFSGADHGVVPTPEKTQWDSDTAKCFRFVLDGVTYVAVEDEEDGYRSSMRCLFISPDTNVPPVSPVLVTITHRTTGEYGESDLLIATVTASGKELFRVGTENTNDYYPWFEAHYDIGALPGNAGK